MAVVALRAPLNRSFSTVVLGLFVIGAAGAAVTGVARTVPLINYYGVADLNRFYMEFRNIVLATCSNNAPIYLALREQHHKFRQMATLYLHDRELVSDWTDDGYIFPLLPVDQRAREVTRESCVVEPVDARDLLSRGVTIGPFRVGIFEGQVQIESVSGSYERESDGRNWWHWVEREVTFKLRPRLFSKELTQTKLHFEYATRGYQTLTIRMTKRDGTGLVVMLNSNGESIATFERVIDLRPSKVTELRITTDGSASPLGPHDPRMAALLVRNVAIKPHSPTARRVE